MPGQGRLTDNANVPACGHGCKSCSHNCTGPAIRGSENVLVNGLPALRVGDPGIHSSCCGGNKWNAAAGSGTVIINGKPAHRLGDATQHCGGVGKLIADPRTSSSEARRDVPGLQVIKILGAAKFYSHGLTLPEQWNPPRGEDGKQYNDAIPAEMRVAVPRLVPPWFRPAEATKPFQDVCDTIGKDFRDLHDRMCDAVVFAHNLWKLQARFQNVSIVGPIATGGPGSLNGPALESLIKSAPSCVSMIYHWAKYRDAVAKGVSQCFTQWQSGVAVPGLPWYPPYAAMPAGPAPPIPNIPMPLISCVSPMMSQITTAPPMAQAMQSALQHKFNNEQIRALFDAIASTLSMAFMTWLPAQQVMMVLVNGASTAAPPLTPVGMVVGMNISTPGHLMS